MDNSLFLLPDIFLKNLQKNEKIGYIFQELAYPQYINMIIDILSSSQDNNIDHIVKKHCKFHITEEYGKEWLNSLQDALNECNCNDKNKIMIKATFIITKLVMNNTISMSQIKLNDIIDKYEKNNDIHTELNDLLNYLKLK